MAITYYLLSNSVLHEVFSQQDQMQLLSY